VFVSDKPFQCRTSKLQVKPGVGKDKALHSGRLRPYYEILDLVKNVLQEANIGTHLS